MSFGGTIITPYIKVKTRMFLENKVSLKYEEEDIYIYDQIDLSCTVHHINANRHIVE